MAKKRTYEELEQRVKKLEEEAVELQRDAKEKRQCWEFFECNEKECPAYKSKESCWLISGTHCRKEIQGKFFEKIENCLACEVFMANLGVDSMQETLTVISKQFTKYRTTVSTEMAERRYSEERLHKMKDCFLSFGSDTIENINLLTRLCGELLGGTCALYNRLEGELLCSLGQWNTPPDYNPRDKPEGHICFDVIQKGEDEVMVVRDLPNTPYAKTDPNVIPYNLQTYIGKAVKCGDEHVGSLCVVFQSDIVPNEYDKRVLEIAASAIGVEEERKRSEERVEEQLRFLQTLVDTLPTPVFYKDKYGKYTGCNKAFEEFVGRPREKIIGKTVYDMGPKRIANKYYEKDRELFQNPGKQVYEWKVKRKSGELRQVVFNKATFTDVDGKVAGLIGGIFDITERKQAEEALREREAALEARTRELEEVNSALTVLLKRRDEDKTETEEKVLFNVKELVVPYAEKLRKTSLDKKQIAYLNILESNLNNIISPFTYRLSSKYLGLTPKEIHIANLIKDGKTAKEIAGLFNVSVRTIEAHRKSIRAKIGLKNSKINLRSRLLCM